MALLPLHTRTRLVAHAGTMQQREGTAESEARVVPIHSSPRSPKTNLTAIRTPYSCSRSAIKRRNQAGQVEVGGANDRQRLWRKHLRRRQRRPL